MDMQTAMRSGVLSAAIAVFAFGITPRAQQTGVLLETLTWLEAKERLTPDTVVVIPLGAGSKEHGPHLSLANDFIMAEYFKRRVLAAANVVIAPTVNYHFYPAFVNYPGSTTVSANVARDLIVDICRSLAAHGPRRFYILNTGVSTVGPLRASQALLKLEGIEMAFTDIIAVADAVVKGLSEQQAGTHADEIETSIMLYIAPNTVNMSKASKDYPTGTGPLTPTKGAPGRYSPSGISGDATLATRVKGEKVVEATVAGILREIEALRQVRVSR
jgi:creatinine amidohydrolase